jgi:hypothetical protein
MVIHFKEIARLLGLFMACLWLGLMTGCGNPTVVGLRPEYPPVEKRWNSLFPEFVEVDTLAPTFRWQPFNIALVAASTPQGDACIDNVTYEIRIWQTASGGTGRLVYAREELTAAEHRIEQPLHAGTRYAWSVRAHFEVNGRHRITEWTLAGYPLRNETVPNHSCLHFKTPLAGRIK